MITRVRIEAEGDSVEDVIAQLNGAFRLVFANSIGYEMQPVGNTGNPPPAITGPAFGGDGWPNTTSSHSIKSGAFTVSSAPPANYFSVPPIFSRDSEFVEEVFESHIEDNGAIRYSGRRVVKFVAPPPGIRAAA